MGSAARDGDRTERVRDLLGRRRRDGDRLPLHRRRCSLPVAVLLAGPEGASGCTSRSRTRSSSCGSRSAFGPRVTTTARRTTARSSARPRRARSRSRARRPYRGETKLPFILQNVHRYFMYLAVIVLGFLWYDTGRAFLFTNAHGSLEFGVGLGSLIMLANVVLLSLFTFGCNSVRHLIGGRLDCFTCSASARTRHQLWRGVTCPQRAPYAVGVVQPHERRRDRPVHPARRVGRVPRPEDLLRCSRAPPLRRARDRRGWCRTARGDRGRGTWRAHWPRVQVTARQGSHGDGRGRSRRRVRKRRTGR